VDQLGNMAQVIMEHLDSHQALVIMEHLDSHQALVTMGHLGKQALVVMDRLDKKALVITDQLDSHQTQVITDHLDNLVLVMDHLDSWDLVLQEAITRLGNLEAITALRINPVAVSVQQDNQAVVFLGNQANLDNRVHHQEAMAQVDNKGPHQAVMGLQIEPVNQT